MPKKPINSAIIIYDHENALLTLSDIQKKAFPNVRGLCGASDYGPFSAHSTSFSKTEYATVR
jgi:hypothetical protein